MFLTLFLVPILVSGKQLIFLVYLSANIFLKLTRPLVTHTFLAICEWHGITCDDQQTNVIGIDLVGYNIAGPISPSLGLLSSLLHINLSKVRLHFVCFNVNGKREYMNYAHFLPFLIHFLIPYLELFIWENSR